MGNIIAVAAQKGGVGKSTIARALGTCYSSNDWDTKIGDLDISQSTTYNWQRRRLEENIQPVISVECFGTVSQALKKADNYDMFIFDGAPHATKATLEMSQVADLVVIPTGFSLDDLHPTVLLANELVSKGVALNKIVIVFCRTGDSEREYEDAKDYLAQTPYFVADGRMQEKTAFRRASDSGRSAIECTYKGPREQADKLIQNIINRLEEITK